VRKARAETSDGTDGYNCGVLIMRTREQLTEAIKRHKNLQRSWKAEAAEMRAAGFQMAAEGCLQASESHKRSLIICEAELEACNEER